MHHAKKKAVLDAQLVEELKERMWANMRSWNLITSVRGVKCHFCGDFIRPTKQYCKWKFPGKHHMLYRNCCVKCFKQEAEYDVSLADSYIKNLEKSIEMSSKMNSEYLIKDQEICSGCRNRVKNVTGLCSPLKRGCQFRRKRAYDAT